MASVLDEFVADHLTRAWQPGKVDCLLALADWCMWRGYPDAAAHLRGSYDSEDGFRAIIERAGGVIPLVQGCTDFLGLARIGQPMPDAIAIVGSRSNIQRQWGAIYDGDATGWRVRFVDAYPVLKARPLAIWKL
jgi:hypothetical protein